MILFLRNDSNWLFAGLMFLFILSGCRTQAPLSGENDLRIENVRFEQNNETVHVYYDLTAPDSELKFLIQLILELEDGSHFVIDQSSLQGDAGEGVTPGVEKQIIWNVLQDFPQGIDNSQIQFAVNALPVTVERNRYTWLYVASAVLTIGASISAGIMLSGTNGSGNGAGNLPPPPSRPGN